MNSLTEEKKSGKFKTNIKIIEFVGFGPNTRYRSNKATVDANHLAQFNAKFLITIYEDGTVDVEDQEAPTTDAEKQRFLDMIFEKTVLTYTEMHIIKDLPFKSYYKVRDKHIDLYLSIEPENRIKNILSMLDEQPKSVSITESQRSKLEAIFGEMDEEEDIEPVGATISETPELVPKSNEHLEEAFRRIKEDKIRELKKNLEEKNSLLDNHRKDILTLEHRVKTLKSDIDLLSSRLEQLVPNKPENGYCFFVGEKVDEKNTLEQPILDIIYNKLSKIKNINADAFIKLFESGKYEVFISKIKEDSFDKICNFESLDEDLKSALESIPLEIEDGKFVYYGDLSWHDLVQKMLYLGFSQNPDFDKICGSNSYSNN